MQPRTSLFLPRSAGFTLVELLVALVAMALMALMGWRGLDSMMRSQQYTQAHSDAHAVLQTALAQWSADLDGLMALENTQAIAWDGLVLRMTRRNNAAPEAGALVVAWALGTSQGRSQWLRWQSPPVRTRAEWSRAWNQAAQWARNPSQEQRGGETALFPLGSWSIYFYRDGAWSNPQSSGASSSATAEAANAAATAATATAGTAGTGTVAGTAAGAAASAAAGTAARSAEAEIPNGVRIELDLAPGAGLSGRLTRDWVNPLRQNIRS
ncbi:PulJ/GspJ family protein [Comamonas endophytica]|uniref:Prepilin-type N-terminal cleavage/methylation domain-containing protein n=1 Tax=Comamonas endophytica TaxID=2949090 RepID=A0ABY6GCF3_9BURK|nr:MULTISPECIES: prepilin-type N-terminal cleavage/methylation domain-containing protein [unclassified Acidovorax]MCD2512886.1 prepilin-type N-terminal cleavage/methylation domain-containing protein [Acidovorax sp. D4N7]UYG52767.1 prepilin-type N-terminal cleavage/methylation domain-containing protein [Acidovorax sp. 5MLIR]